ncbi:hypothetical protein RR49_00310 [Microbacterium ginsengisoli]|uniref:DNA methyltransferase n=1 Tax=Microbacterium ginsengisoli TaxID=400772 RepID=A0A0F0M0L1_9MICO|nr:MT-A70 family methyltransferase [Microbacterium ginsengisoli]KJL42012.1 hypothetical protein RR49_00310 [Microbacterium ginsengisoli]MBN9209586.1 hypothetical protein [Microbacterium ginsengisoli]
MTNINPPVTPAPDCLAQYGPYDAILADVPWPGQTGEKHYDTMSLSEISGLADAVKSVSAENAWLFFWTTKGLFHEAQGIMRDWGFEPIDWITWGKLNRYGMGGIKSGVRRATEYLLVGTRGKVTPASHVVPDWFAAWVAKHSEKPHFQYAYVDALAGMDVKRLELFARHKQPGWDVWGNEIESDVSFLKFGYAVPSDFTDNRKQENGRES